MRVPQEFDHTTLIRGKTSDLLDDLADEGSAAGEVALGAADAALGGLEGRGFLYFADKKKPMSAFFFCSLYVAIQIHFQFQSRVIRPLRYPGDKISRATLRRDETTSKKMTG